jgi:hypothetical protein
MNKCCHVVLTYLYRPRFWISGTLYLMVSLVLGNLMNTSRHQNLKWEGFDAEYHMACSVLFACIVSSLVALHLRRQFAGANVQLVPGFRGPHLMVGALASAMVWIAVPWGVAALTETRPLITIAAHSLAGVFLAIVVIWPKAIVLLGAVLYWMMWSLSGLLTSKSYGILYLLDSHPVAAASMIVLAVMGYGIAAVFLLRLSDNTIAASDDFVVETPGAERATGRWRNRWFALRDAEIDWQLAGREHWLWPYRRWRIPGAVSWSALGATIVLVVVLIVASWFIKRDPVVPLLVAIVCSGVMLFAPFSSWRFRCNSLGCEFMRPVTREHFVRQFVMAFALDFFLWTSMASLITIPGYFALIWEDKSFSASVLWVHLAVLWSIAILLYGIGLVTLRFRYWVPILISYFLASVVAIMISLGMLINWFERWFRDSTGISHQIVGVILLMFALAAPASMGLLLAWRTYRRWLDMDLT